MTVNRRVVEDSPILSSDSSRKPIADAEGHFDDRTVIVDRCEVLVNRGTLERSRGSRRIEIVERKKRDECPLN
jgi:hypothetical protein